MDVADFNRELGGFPARTSSFALAGWASQTDSRRQVGNLFATYLGQTPGERLVENFLRRNQLDVGVGTGALAGLMPGLAALNSGALAVATVPQPG